MNLRSIQQSIANTVKRQGERLKGATPTLVAVALASGALIPLVQGDSNAVFTLLTELGIATFSDFISDFLEKMREKYGKKKLKDAELQKELESEMLSVWEGGGESAETLRKDISILLQSVHGVEKALAASSKELKEVLTQQFAALGGEFQEFRWVLDEIKDALADIQRRQTVQLATQKEQLELQREQLTKTNLLLKMQREEEKRIPIEEEKAGDESLPPADIPCPYKGLAAFQPQDAEDFFGREELVAELLTRLTGTNFLGVVGPSGSGKSSVVRAGVIPSIWAGEIPGSDTWKTVIMTPGEKPLEELAVRIALQCGISAGSLMDDLKKDPANLRLGVKQALAEEPADARLVMVVDQFEEVFTLCQDPKAREAYISALMSAIHGKDSQAIVILALRADFYGRCAAYPALASLLADNQVLVGAMSEEELRRAITLPAQRVGLRLETGLVEMVLREVAHEPGALPMLSHALMETWQRRSGNLLTVQGYLDSGGVSGAVAQTAESVYQGLTDEQKAIARNLFLRLTEIGEGIEATSRRTEFTELMSGTGQDTQINQVLQVLSDARLVITREEVAEVAHEALFDEWPTLRSWLEEDREGLRIHRQLTQAARQWEDLDKDSSALFRGVRLEQTFQWSKDHEDEMNLLEANFLKASQSLRKRNRIFQISSLSLLFLILSFAIVIFNQQAIEAEKLAMMRYSDNLAIQSQFKLPENYELAALLAIESGNVSMDASGSISDTSYQAISLAYNYSHLLRTYRGHTSNVDSAVFSPDGSMVVTASRDDEAHVWDLKGNNILVLHGHTDDVNSAVFSPDGKYILTASWDDSARVWDLDGNTISTLQGHTDDVYTANFSPNGKFIVTGSRDGTARLWDLEGNTTAVLPGHQDLVVSATFSPDGKYILTGSLDFTARLWDFEGNTIAILQHELGVLSATFSPDGQNILTSTVDGTTNIWTIYGDRILVLIGHHDSAVYKAAYSPDGNLIVTASQDGTARVWDLKGNTIAILKGHADEVFSAAFSPNGEQIVTASVDHTARVWDLEGNSLAILQGHTGQIVSASFSPDGEYILTGSADSTARIWDMDIDTHIVLQDSAISFRSADFDPTGNFIVSSSLSKIAYVWDFEGNIIAILNGHSEIINSTSISPDGHYVLTASNDDTAILWDVEGNIIASLQGHTNDVNSAVFSPNSKYIVTASRDGTARLWDLDGNPLVILQGHTSNVFTANFNPDGKYIVTASRDGTARLWDLDGNPLVILQGHTDWVESAIFSPEGKHILTISRDFTARVWDFDGNTIGELMGHTWFVVSATFSPDGKYIVTASYDKTARVWDLNGNTLAVLQGHTNEVQHASFSPDSQYIVTASFDDTVKVWDLKGTLIKELQGHTDDVFSAVFSPDGQYILSTSRDNTTRVWEFIHDTDKIIQKLNERINRQFSTEECEIYLIRECP